MTRKFHVGAQNDALFITSGRAPASTNDYPDHDADRTCIAKVFDEGEARRLVTAANAAATASNDAEEQSVEAINAILEPETGFRVEHADSVGGPFLRLQRKTGATWEAPETVAVFPRDTRAHVFHAMGGLAKHYYDLGKRQAKLY